MELANIENQQLSQELPDEVLEFVVGGKTNPLTDWNPSAEVGSPSLYNLDPHSATQSSRQ